MGLSTYTEWLASLPEEERKIIEKENAEAEAILEEFGKDTITQTVMPFTIQSMVAKSETHDLNVQITAEAMDYVDTHEKIVNDVKNTVLSSSG